MTKALISKGAAHELKVAMSENLDEDAIRKFLLDQHCEFIFNSPTSSHMGGLWERCIRNIRSALDVVLWKHNAQLDSSSLRTFFYEVMAIINGRPLTHQNINDPDAPSTIDAKSAINAENKCGGSASWKL